MANLPNTIASEEAGLQDGELQTITRQLNETRRENESLIIENSALKLVNDELKKQFQEKDKELVELRGKLQAADEEHRELQELGSLNAVCFLTHKV